MKVYGLPNCDTTRAALKWLKEHKLHVEFFDVKSGVSAELLHGFLQHLPLEKLLNKKSTTWRSLPADEQAKAATIDGAIALIQKNASLIKRPVIEWNKNTTTAGFDETLFAKVLGTDPGR
jgi:arsenate reductase